MSWTVCEARTCVESTVECRPLCHTNARPAPCALDACTRLFVGNSFDKQKVLSKRHIRVEEVRLSKIDEKLEFCSMLVQLA